jgi:hypothetical protein
VTSLDGLRPDVALQLIGRLRQGRNIIFGADLFSVGREQWVRGADQVFRDIEVTGDSVVRFIRGVPGVGKTNFAARLFHVALRRGWTAAYIELSEEVMLNEFHQVFSQVVDKLYIPAQLTAVAVDPMPPTGFLGILDLYYQRTRAAMGLSPGADIPASAVADVLARVNSVLVAGRIYTDFAAAVRAYVLARMNAATEQLEPLRRWFRADPDIKLPDLGVLRPISKINAKDHLRSVSAFLAAIGYRGMLIIIDELERIMEESRLRRRKAYTLLRELIDNVDGENGMRNTCFYAAAPPSQFESQKGFIEVEPLASRIQAPILARPGVIDYMATIVDLDAAPLSEREQLELGMRLRAIHARARNLAPGITPSDAEVARLVGEIRAARPYASTRVREFCQEFISALEGTYMSSR